MKKIVYLVLFLVFIIAPNFAFGDSATLISNLRTCKPYEETSPDVITGRLNRKKIYGIYNNKCIFREKISDNQVFECYFPLSVLNDVADQDELGTKLAKNPSSADIKRDNKGNVFINGKLYKDTLKELTNSGVCKIIPIKR